MIDYNKESLMNYLDKAGINDIIAIYFQGSAVYFKNYRDIDIVVITKNTTVALGKVEIDKKRYDIVCWSLEDYNSPVRYRNCSSVGLYADMVLIHGNDESVHRYDVLQDKWLPKYLTNLYRQELFDWKKGTYRMDDKRIWNFLLFYYRFKNKSLTITEEQWKEIKKAHSRADCIEKYRPLLDDLHSLLQGGM